MVRMLYTGLRLLVVLAFLLAMPVLALPPVADWCEAQLYPPPARRRVVTARPPPLAAAPAPVSAASPTVDRSVQTAGFEQSAAPDGSAVGQMATYERPAPTGPDELARLAAEVQRLGATFYRLEMADPAIPTYRFVAQFERPGLPPARWQAAAIDRDPAEAIRQVIAQVSAGEPSDR